MYIETSEKYQNVTRKIDMVAQKVPTGQTRGLANTLKVQENTGFSL